MCGSYVCSGNCQSGGSSGGSETTTETGKTPLVDKIYHSNSTLTKEQKIKLEKAIDEFIKKYPEFKEMYDKLVENNIKLICKIDPQSLESSKGLASYDARTQSLLFKEEYYIKEVYIQEELIHAVQHLEFYGNDMFTSRKNVEFEAKVVQDLLMYKHIGYGAEMGFVGQNNDFMSTYSEFVNNYTIQDFHNLCT